MTVPKGTYGNNKPSMQKKNNLRTIETQIVQNLKLRTSLGQNLLVLIKKEWVYALRTRNVTNYGFLVTLDLRKKPSSTEDF